MFTKNAVNREQQCDNWNITNHSARYLPRKAKKILSCEVFVPFHIIMTIT